LNCQGSHAATGRDHGGIPGSGSRITSAPTGPTVGFAGSARRMASAVDAASGSTITVRWLPGIGTTSRPPVAISAQPSRWSYTDGGRCECAAQKYVIVPGYRGGAYRREAA